MNLYYAIMTDGIPRFAPNPILMGEKRIGNPGASVYLSLGYKPVLAESRPTEHPAEGFDWALSWTESQDAILGIWEQLPIPVDQELDSETALNILLGGAAHDEG